MTLFFLFLNLVLGGANLAYWIHDHTNYANLFVAGWCALGAFDNAVDLILDAKRQRAS